MSDAIANNIRRYRKKRNLTQAELANKVGISQMSIRRYESVGSENREPTFDILQKIANALGVSFAEITDSLECENIFSIHINDIPFIKDNMISPDIMNVKEIVNEFKDSPFTLLTDSEKLIVYFNSLNDEGREKLFDYLETLLEVARYRKLNISENNE